ncbi:hypothetical protein GCM10009119_17750 [Algoriphagus jejuensis]|uniref:Tetratricopeptide repeat protein n=1 Tax=Algoriphagus jejuensis TaxID=419934 RepID=A0ABN1MZX0_9BACT
MDLQELIDNYLEGKMSPEDERLFEKLIAENPQHQAELEQQKKGREALNLAERHATRSNMKSWALSTAIACFLVLSGYLLWITLGMSPGEKLYAKHYNTFPNQIASGTLETSNTKLLSEAFQAYDAKDFKKAEVLFGQIPHRADSDYLLLYQGICQLELGRPEKAIPLFNLVKSESNAASKEVACWYAALGYFKLNMLEKGKDALRVSASRPNLYQEQAKSILRQLE